MNQTLELQSTDKNNALLDDCVAIWTENDFISRWHRIKAYHEIGTRILEEGSNYGDKTVTLVANSIGKSTRNVYRAIEFAKMFPNLDSLPEGKNTTWYSVIHKYLPTKIEGQDINKLELVYVCSNCNFEHKKDEVKFVRKAY